LVDVLRIYVVKCHGISQDPQGNYVMVMEYIEDSSLMPCLKRNSLSSNSKGGFSYLCFIVFRLDEIHKKELIHCDLHTGNVLKKNDKLCFITDLGLCRPINETDQGKVYGVTPYIAPEVLRGKPYTKASDIYSFGILTYELLNNTYPYHEFAHDNFLAVKICQGLRPNLNEIIAPQSLKDLIEKC